MAALRDLNSNSDVLVLPADKGNATVVVNTVDYERKLNQLVSDASTYKKVSYNPTSRVTAKVIKLLKESENDDLVTRLRPHNPTSPKIYGLPKIHKPDWPLRPIVSQIDAPTYQLSKYLAAILHPLTGKTSSHVRDSRHFVRLLADTCIQPTEMMVSFDVASLFTNVPIEDSINVITDLIHSNNLPIEYIEWTKYCLNSGYFAWRDEYYLQVDGVAMGSPIAPVVANIFMEWFENRAMMNTSLKPRCWWRYVDDVFAVITKDALESFTSYLNTVHSKIQFTVETEKDGVLPFLDVLVTRKHDGTLAHTVYRKPTHTDRYLQADSHHHVSHLAAVSRSLINRALSICDPQHVHAELEHVKSVLESNGYNWRQCTRWASKSERKRPDTVERSPIYLPFVKGVTDEIGHYLDRRYGIKTRFRPPGQLRRFLRSPKDKEPLSGPGVYKIPCDCGVSYIGETRRNISTRITEHIRSIRNLDTDRSAVAQHAHISDSRHYIRFDKVSVLAREKFFVPRKVREAIEIGRHATFNRDQGWSISPSWKPVLSMINTKILLECEMDTISAVCLDPNAADISSGSDDSPTTELTNIAERARTPPTPPAASAEPRTRRQLRASARDLRRGLIS